MPGGDDHRLAALRRTRSSSGVEVVVARGDLDRVDERLEPGPRSPRSNGVQTNAEAARARERRQLARPRPAPSAKRSSWASALGLRGRDEARAARKTCSLTACAPRLRGALDQLARDAEVALVVVADLGDDRDPLGGVDGVRASCAVQVQDVAGVDGRGTRAARRSAARRCWRPACPTSTGRRTRRAARRPARARRRRRARRRARRRGRSRGVAARASTPRKPTDRAVGAARPACRSPRSPSSSAAAQSRLIAAAAARRDRRDRGGSARRRSALAAMSSTASRSLGARRRATSTPSAPASGPASRRSVTLTSTTRKPGRLERRDAARRRRRPPSPGGSPSPGQRRRVVAVLEREGRAAEPLGEPGVLAHVSPGGRVSGGASATSSRYQLDVAVAGPSSSSTCGTCPISSRALSIAERAAEGAQRVALDVLDLDLREVLLHERHEVAQRARLARRSC